MSRNPYEQPFDHGRNPQQRPPTGYGPGYGAPAYDPEGAMYAQPPRTSVMALLSFFCSIPCCFIPIFPPLGVILGAVAVSLISSSRGRLAGRGFAIAGIILGILTTTLWVATIFGGVQVFTFYNKQMVPTVSQVIAEGSAGRPDQARAVLGATAQGEVSDERLAAFIGAIELAHGEVAGASGSFEMVGRGFERARQQQLEIPDFGNIQGAPLAIQTATGPIFAYAFFDKAALNTQSVELLDILVYIDDSKVVTLRESGPAASFAASIGLDVVDLGAAPAPDAAPAPPAEPEPAGASGNGGAKPRF